MTSLWRNRSFILAGAIGVGAIVNFASRNWQVGLWMGCSSAWLWMAEDERRLRRTWQSIALKALDTLKRQA